MEKRAMLPLSLKSSRKRIWAVLAMFTLISLALPVAAGDKKKKATADPSAQLPKRVNFDLSKIVWPNPPAITRVRYLQQFTGEKIDFNTVVKGKQKVKQGWMDRLAGTKPQADQNLKLPFQLIRTTGLAFDSKGRVFAADQGVGAIFIFDAEKKGEVELIKNGEDAHFGLINGLAIDDNDRIFVSDDKMHRISIITPAKQGPAKWQEEPAFGADLLARPGGLAIDTENRFLYVVDTQNDVVDVFDADTYKLLRKIGVAGKKHTLTDPGTFSLPTNVAVDKDGNVYVTDTLNNRVQIFDADGKFISMFGKNGDGPGYLARPKGIAIDGDGHIWVVDAVQQRVQVFNNEGQLLIYFGEAGNWPGQFSAPYDIAIDTKFNRVVTSEQFPGRVQMFRYTTDAEAEQLRIERAKNEGVPAGGETANAKSDKKDSAPQ
jgi:DNA-binding beta-propeller fold protein YncE